MIQGILSGLAALVSSRVEIDVSDFKAQETPSGDIVLSGCGIDPVIMDLDEAKLVRDRLSESIERADKCRKSD
jgi:hypothetical protein